MRLRDVRHFSNRLFDVLKRMFGFSGERMHVLTHLGRYSDQSSSFTSRFHFENLNRSHSFEGLPGGVLFPCSLVPFQNCPMFPCSHTLSECFRTVIFLILFPCSQKLANVPLFPSIFCQCSLVPQNPWETLSFLHDATT